MYSNRNGVSELYDYGDNFALRGGEDGPTFGCSISIEVSYSDNKAAINAFLAFMFETGDSDSE
jgi:hypothetical protein